MRRHARACPKLSRWSECLRARQSYLNLSPFSDLVCSLYFKMFLFILSSNFFTKLTWSTKFDELYYKASFIWNNKNFKEENSGREVDSFEKNIAMRAIAPKINFQNFIWYFRCFLLNLNGGGLMIIRCMKGLFNKTKCGLKRLSYIFISTLWGEISVAPINMIIRSKNKVRFLSYKIIQQAKR